MYLKSIELCGFKSFADRTILNFDRELTAIVGPNGCGKSNIVDSIRWVLGEQSAYSLRTPQMLGIIFNGSQTRPPLNLAEVSITFDNSSHILPIDYTEVTVTRKLFRSGESEYYINKTQCRLKDIRDLFLDTGIGREGYSIFEQGKVEFITTAKPEERRALFEEAAGVAKYKVKREETLRKLEKVHENMNRVNDIMSVIKEQINSLETAVRKAKLFQKYQEELRTLEIADITKKIDSLNKDLEPLTDKIESLNREQIEKSTQINLIESELSNLQYEKTNIERELSELYRNLSQNNGEIAHCEERIENSQIRIKEFKDRQTNLTNEIAELITLRKNTEEVIKKISEELNNASETFQKITTEYETKQKEYENIKSEIAKNQNQINRFNKQLFEKIFEKTSINNEIGKINSNITAISAKISSLISELKKISNEKTSLEKEIEKLNIELSQKNEKLNEIQNIYTNELKILSELEEKYNSKKQHYAEIKEKYSAVNSRIETIKELQKLDPKLRPVYKILSQNFPGIYGTVKSVLNFPSYISPIITNFLGEKLNYIICESISSARSAIEYLEKNKLGWASFIVLEMLPEIKEKKFLGELK
ncbi:MAG: chromosome segregation SMC family protein, partial [Endomicrobiia bacterium]